MKLWSIEGWNKGKKIRRDSWFDSGTYMRYESGLFLFYRRCSDNVDYRVNDEFDYSDLVAKDWKLWVKPKARR